MSTLLEIGHATQAAIDYVENNGGEVTEAYEQTSMALAQKVDRCVAMKKAFQIIVSQLKAERDALVAEIKRVEAAEERFEEQMLFVMATLDKTELEGEESVLKRSPTKGKVVIIDKVSCETLFGEPETIIKIPLDKIREALAENPNLGVAKIEQGWSLKAVKKRSIK